MLNNMITTENVLKESMRKVEDEMRFLHQDGYSGEWAEMKKNDIKEILSSALDRQRQSDMEEVMKMCEEIEAPGEDEIYDDGFFSALATLKTRLLEANMKKVCTCGGDCTLGGIEHRYDGKPCYIK